MNAVVTYIDLSSPAREKTTRFMEAEIRSCNLEYPTPRGAFPSSPRDLNRETFHAQPKKLTMVFVQLHFANILRAASTWNPE